jgi:DNA primase
LADEWVALIRQVKEANDIVDVVGSYVTLHRAGQQFKGLCPFHNDRHPSFYVDPQWQNYRCWSCGKHGDVLQFIQEQERVDFREALEMLARRAGITLEKKGDSPHNRGRAAMLEVLRWAVGQFQQCLLDSPLAEAARQYLGERKLTGETVRRFGLGYAPLAGDWLVQRAEQARVPLELLEKVGLVAARSEGSGYYDRFRDRVQFPIRDPQGRPVGFGGRILPSSPLSSRAPKYYNSCDTPLFSKSEQLYGIDLARQAGIAAGYLAVVEGYTDVLMAHQMGIPQVVATMGTALNARHVQHLRRFVPRVVLVFDADAGGATGVDRALELFVSQDVDLAIATLPEGLDPCDLLVQQGPEPFKAALASAVDALDFKLNQVLAGESASTIENKRRAVEAVLGIIALAPEMPGQAGAIKQQLVVTRIAQRLGLREESVWARLRELRAARKPSLPEPRRTRDDSSPQADPPQAAVPAARERQLLQMLLAEPELVAVAAAEVRPEDIDHPGLRKLLAGLYALKEEGHAPELDQLRARLDNPQLAEHALKLQEVGRMTADRPARLRQLLDEFHRRRLLPEKRALQNQLQTVPDHATAVELLRQLQNRTTG